MSVIRIAGQLRSLGLPLQPFLAQLHVSQILVVCLLLRLLQQPRGLLCRYFGRSCLLSLEVRLTAKTEQQLLWVTGGTCYLWSLKNELMINYPFICVFIEDSDLMPVWLVLLLSWWCIICYIDRCCR